MDKCIAKLYDSLLLEISKMPDSGWHTSHISESAEKVGFKTDADVKKAIACYLEDGYIDFIKHPNAPHHNFGIYNITGKGIKFINFEGGYNDKRKYDNYDKVNKHFTWIRHWVWFYTAVISLLCNAFFILNYFYKWL